MVHIPIETAPYLEAAIYLPMRMILLEKGYAQIEAGQFKLKRPYFHLIETARKVLKKIESEGVFKKHHLKSYEVVRINCLRNISCTIIKR